MKSLIVNLAISAEEFQQLYMGHVQSVVARSLDGRNVRFPAAILRPYVLHNGVRGQFEIVFDESNRFQAINRLSQCR